MLTITKKEKEKKRKGNVAKIRTYMVAINLKAKSEVNNCHLI